MVSTSPVLARRWGEWGGDREIPSLMLIASPICEKNGRGKDVRMGDVTRLGTENLLINKLKKNRLNINLILSLENKKCLNFTILIDRNLLGIFETGFLNI